MRRSKICAANPFRIRRSKFVRLEVLYLQQIREQGEGGLGGIISPTLALPSGVCDNRKLLEGNVSSTQTHAKFWSANEIPEPFLPSFQAQPHPPVPTPSPVPPTH